MESPPIITAPYPPPPSEASCPPRRTFHPLVAVMVEPLLYNKLFGEPEAISAGLLFNTDTELEAAVPASHSVAPPPPELANEADTSGNPGILNVPFTSKFSV